MYCGKCLGIRVEIGCGRNFETLQKHRMVRYFSIFVININRPEFNGFKNLLSKLIPESSLIRLSLITDSEMKNRDIKELAAAAV